MKLSELIELYNFKQFHGDKEDTQIIRIYLDISEWFEFGVNDWGYQSGKESIVKKVLPKKLLEREVTSFNYDNDRDVFSVWLEYEG